MEQPDLIELTQKLDYTFQNESLLHEALNHSSFVNEQGESALRDNERLEFLGDAVLNLVVGHILMDRYPHLKEGELSRIRANLVNETQLAWVARGIDLGRHIRLGKGELQTNGSEKNSILADAYEALIAAVYLDNGFEAAYKIIENCLSSSLVSITDSAANYDFKSQLQELVQINHGSVPEYRIVKEVGPDHDKTFHVEVKVLKLLEQGTGKSKKMAEQSAAQKALEILRAEKELKEPNGDE